jgi:putative DNA primase/helicase
MSISIKNLTKTDLENLQSSFITKELAKRAGIYRVDSATGAQLVGQTNNLAKKEDLAGIVFPNIAPGETEPREVRLRRDNPSLEAKADGSTKEHRKYLAPPGKGNYFYFAPGCKKEWLADESLPVVITEGEKKTLALDRAAWLGLSDAAERPKFLAVGLSGVWNFRGTVARTVNASGNRVPVKGLIPDFQLINWKKRIVYLLFDADVQTNESVAAARRRLASELRALGAHVLFVDLPKDSKEKGIDDILGGIEREKSETAAGDFLADLLSSAGETDQTAKSSPYELREDGVYFIDSDGNETFICSPLHIVAETHTASGENYGKLTNWHDSKKRLHRWAIPIELLHTDSADFVKYLVSRGLELVPTRQHRSHLAKYIVMSKPTQTIICTDRVGWQNNLFVLPEKTIGEAMNDSERTIFQSASGIDHCYATKGTLEDWQNNVARYCTGNSRLVFAVSTAFAAALLTPLVENGGGFHFRGPSSVGKSTALFVAGSVWGGDDRRGFIDTWRTTANGLETIAALHNDSLLCLDELKECDPKTVGEAAYMLPNGKGKGRATKNVTARRSLTWNLLFLSSGELSLSDLVEQNGGRVYGGQEVRMCDIPADAGKGLGLFDKKRDFPTAELLAKTLQENARNYYGTPIIHFLEYISRRLDKLKDWWIKFRSDFMTHLLPKTASAEVQRVAARFALVAFAGYLARDICKWTTTEATEASERVFRAWLAGRDGEGQSDMDKAVGQIRYFIEAHGESRFQPLNTSPLASSPARTITNRVGFKRFNVQTDETEYLIFPESFRKEVCKGFDYKAVAAELAERGYLDKGSDRPEKIVRLDEFNNSSTRFFIIRANIFGNDKPDAI